MRKWTIALVVIALAAVFVGGCGFGDDQSREDANDIQVCDGTSDGDAPETTDGCINKQDPSAIAFNNEYPNVEMKCDGYGHRVYVNTDKDMVVVPDPTCDGYTPETAAGLTATGAN